MNVFILVDKHDPTISALVKGAFENVIHVLASVV
jgi:hypothetical protein